MRINALMLACAFATTAAAHAADYVVVPGGSFASVMPPDGKAERASVATHRLRTQPVTNAEFLEFVRMHAKWRRDRVPSLFADGRYLSHWPASLKIDAADAARPVTHVSWFAAQAFCEAENARLPTWYEFEHAAAADETRSDARSDPDWRERILGWYARPSTAALPEVGRDAANVYGAQDLHGLIWEWVGDYASLMISGDNRDQGDPDLLRFCGSGALSTQDRENYAVLMRIAMLSSLKGADTTANVGFRCAQDVR